MTAEVAILNRSAVALAADSALTVGRGSEQKTYHTHKLFRLSEHEPIGIMVFNNASLLGVPWETIIKQYRKDLGVQRFESLSKYAQNFLVYLEGNSFLFPEVEQDKGAIRDVLAGFMFLRRGVDDSIEMMSHRRRRLQLKQIVEVLTIWVETTLEALEKLPLPPTYLPDHKRRVFARYVTAIETVIDEVFQTLPLTVELRKKLRRVGLYLLLTSNRIDGDNYSGIVVAGFGDNDLFPAVEAFKINSVVLDKLRYGTILQNEITRDREVLVYAFAQSEVVRGFMEGITPEMEATIRKSLDAELQILGENLLKSLPRASKKIKDGILQEIGNTQTKVLNTLGESKSDSSNPVMEAVAVLPKAELATMAETLVNLTSFKRRVTLDVESVGGPIDVAVISRGDGFIWIKRKHYFEASQNPHLAT